MSVHNQDFGQDFTKGVEEIFKGQEAVIKLAASLASPEGFFKRDQVDRSSYVFASYRHCLCFAL